MALWFAMKEKPIAARVFAEGRKPILHWEREEADTSRTEVFRVAGGMLIADCSQLIEARLA